MRGNGQRGSPENEAPRVGTQHIDKRQLSLIVSPSTAHLDMGVAHGDEDNIGISPAFRLEGIGPKLPAKQRRWTDGAVCSLHP